MNKTNLTYALCATLLLGCGAGEPGATSAARSAPILSGTQLAALGISLGTDCTATATPDGGAIGACANGCKLVQKPSGYTILDCPQAPIVCAQPADDSEGCWDAPKKQCGGMFGGQLRACSADGSMCCVFPDSCQPCGWVLCDGPIPGQQVPGACKVKSDDPQWLSKCPAGLIDQMHCSVCAGALICPSGTPSEIAPH